MRGVGLAAVGAAACVAVAVGLAREDAPYRPSRSYPLVVHDGAPFIELAIAGRRGLFLLDTGANGSGIDRAWLERSGLEARAAGSTSIAGATGAFSASRVELDRLDLGTGYFKRPVFAVQSFAGFVKPEGRPQVGLIGMDFLGCYEVRLDYVSRRVELALRNERRGVDPRWVRVPVRFMANIPTIDARVGRVTLPLRLDTGATHFERGTLIDVNRATVAALEAKGVRLVPRGSIRVVGVAGPENVPLLEADAGLELGATRFAPVTLVVHERGSLAGSEPVGLLGATVLSRFGRLVLDPFDRALWLPREERKSRKS